jgi:competence protein ComEC
VKNILRNWKIPFVLLFLILNILIWSAVYSIKPKDYVKVSFLDVGQGDSILIEGRNNNRILLDGGKGTRVLRELGKALPSFDRTIDVLIESHPDQDHIGGFPEIISRYKIGMFLEPGVESENSVDDELKRRIEKKIIPHSLARTGQIIDLGDGSYLRILFPDRDVSGLETNDASIVAQFVYGDTCFLLTGDSPLKIEEYLVGKFGERLECGLLKAGHHGSRTSTGENYLNSVKPDFAIISAGKDNSYGHPHLEVTERLAAHNIKILSTIDLGTIKMISDGKEIYVK